MPGGWLFTWVGAPSRRATYLLTNGPSPTRRTTGTAAA